MWSNLIGSPAVVLLLLGSPAALLIGGGTAMALVASIAILAIFVGAIVGEVGRRRQP